MVDMPICKAAIKAKPIQNMKGVCKTRWWKLKDQELRHSFVQKIKQKLLSGYNCGWGEINMKIRETAKNTPGETSSKSKRNKETWWWHDEVQAAIQDKKEKKKQRDMTWTELSREEYKTANKLAKRAVARARHEAYKDLYFSLESGDVLNRAIRLAKKKKHRDSADVYQAKIIKDKNGSALVNDQDISKRWEEYFEQLMNVENERIERDEAQNEESEVEEVSRTEVVSNEENEERQGSWSR